MEVYGDGTWQYFGEETINGTYWLMNNSFDLTESRYGMALMAFPFRDDGKRVIKVTRQELFKTRSAGDTLFYAESEPNYCDDLDRYYEEQYPYREMAGKWYPVGDNSERHFYSFEGTGNWAEIIGAASLEVGVIWESDEGKGKFTASGANSGKTIEIEYPGDGYMYINGEKYERHVDGESAPDSIVGKWYYYDHDNYYITDTGYELFSDWTFKSLPDTASSKRGTYIRVDGNFYHLFDENGKRITTLSQDMWQAVDKEMIDDWDQVNDGRGAMYSEGRKREEEGYNDATSSDGYTDNDGYTGDDNTVTYRTSCFMVDETEFFNMDRTMFGLTYEAFKERVGKADLMQPEAWPWWGHDLEVVYVNEDNETYACLFQYGRFVCVYRDAADEKPGNMFYTAMDTYGDPTDESTYWNGTTAYKWKLDDCYYEQHVETYSESESHYRQQYTSFDYVE